MTSINYQAQDVAVKKSSPFKVRKDLLQKFLLAANNRTLNIKFVVMETIGDPLKRFLAKPDVNDWSMEEVDKYYQVLLVRCSVREKVVKCIKEVEEAEHPPMFCGAMTLAFASLCMYPVIHKKLSKAQKIINQATGVVIRNQNGNSIVGNGNIAQDAMEAILVIVITIGRVHSWFLHADDPSENDKIYSKVSKLLINLLWFTDEELRLIDPFSRRSLIDYFRHFSKEWKGNESNSAKVVVRFETSNNQNGMGRNLAANQALSPSKRARTDIANQSPPAAATTATTTAVMKMDPSSPDDSACALAINFLNALGQDKLALRTKTHVQLEINKLETMPRKVCHVVVSGAMDLKNLGQLVAYLTENTQEYNWHSQRGKPCKHSYFCMELINSDQKTGVFIAEKEMSIYVKTGNVVLDKSVKVAQIFQGLTTGPRSGIVYDSEQAKKVEFTWNTLGLDKHNQYIIECRGIVPNKCCLGKNPQLPRVVNDVVEVTENTKMSLNGKSLYKTNDVLRGDRKIPSKSYVGGRRPSKRAANEDAANPVVNCDDGATIQSGRGEDYMSRKAFARKNIESAGVPPTA